MPYSLSRYHVSLGTKRTTVSLDRTLVELLALKLGYEPDAPPAHAVIRSWLQNKLDQANDPGRSRVSQWLQAQVIHAIVDKYLSKRHARWLLHG